MHISKKEKKLYHDDNEKISGMHPKKPFSPHNLSIKTVQINLSVLES